MQFLTNSAQNSATPESHLEEVRQMYNRTQFNFSKVIPDSWARFNNVSLAKRAGIKPGNYILDAGCGAGIPAIHIAQEFPGVRIEGMTVSDVEAAEGRQRVQAAGLGDRIIIREGDFHYLPFPDGVFDVAFFNDSIKYSNNLPQAFAEAYRVLRPGGRLYMKEMVSKEPPLTAQEQQDLAKLNQDFTCHIGPLSQLAAVAQQAGFQEIQIENLTGKLLTEDFRRSTVDWTNPNAPVFYGEIRASKPASSVGIIPTVRPASHLLASNSDQDLHRVRTLTDSVPINYDQVSTIQRKEQNLYYARQAGIKPGDYVLDAGCGLGGPSIDIANSIPNVRIEAIELSPKPVNQAKLLVAQAGLSDRIRVQEADFHDLPFPDGVFDVVFFLETLCFSTTRQKALAEARRVLRPGGCLYIKDGFCKEGLLSPQEQQELTQWQKIYYCHAPKLSQASEEVRLVGFEGIQARDVSKDLNFDRDLTLMAQKHQLRNLPLILGQIKASKPVSVFHLSPSQSIEVQSDETLQRIKTLAERTPINYDQTSTIQSTVLPGVDSKDFAKAQNLYIAWQAGIKPGDYVLDAGSGIGGPSIDIVSTIPDVRIEAIELSPKLVKQAKLLVAQAGLSDRIRVQEADFHDLPFPDAVFDVVLFLETLGYSKARQKALAEAHRVLRPGGCLYIKDSFCKEGLLSPQEQQELAQLQEIYIYQTPKLSQASEEVRLAGFEAIEARDISKDLNYQRSLTLMAQKHQLPNLPLTLGQIKARKPVLVSHVSPSQSLEVPIPSQTSHLVYALGKLGYDFGTEARRDSFKQLMPGIEIDGTVVPANPYDARQIVDHLVANPSEAKSLIWTLNLELTPIYAIEPIGAFASDVYETLQILLAGEIEAEDSTNYIERVSIPARLTDRTVKLFSGQIVPVIEPENIRGMYGWQVNNLVSAALETVQTGTEAVEEQRVRRTLTSFLNRIYYDLRNWGQTDRDRALNFAATNAFQAASTFAEAVAAGLELDSIEVYKSPYCRYDGNCWDVKLKFFDPENNRRARKMFRFTIDVKDIMPVTLGDVRSWSAPS
jgi:ubiquinone/menaquinone biosynthesis C-methylase UbiE